MQFRHKIFEALKNTPEGWRFCRAKQKAASFPENQYKSPFTLEEVLEMDGDGVGVLLGGHSTATINGKKYGLSAIDADGTDWELNFEHHIGFDPAHLPKTVTVSSGKKDRKQMFYWIPKEYLDVLKKKEFSHEGYANFELRIGNHYSMVAGAHPETDGYFWVNSPADTDVAIAPLLLLEGWEELSKKKESKSSFITYRRTRDELIYDSSRVPRYLERYYSPAIDWATPRDKWIKVIQALRHLSQEWEDLDGQKDKHLKDAHNWCSQMDQYYDPEDLEKTWYSFKRNPNSDDVVKINTFFHNAKQHPNWTKDEVRFQADQQEKPKRKKSELMKDLLEHAKNENSDDYAEDFAEMEIRFRRSPIEINNDLLNQLRNSYGQKNYKVGLVDMSKVKDLEYLLEGFLVRGENHQIFAGAGMGKTSLLAGMIRAGYKGVGFLNQTRHRDPFRTLWVSCDGGSSRWKAVYDDMGLDPSMVDTIGADREQGLTNWKWTIPNLIKLRSQLEKKDKNYGLVVFDPVKGMMSSTGFKYTDNEHADSICQFLREIIAEPFGVAVVLLNHLSTDGTAGSGAKRWGEAVAVNVEIKKVMMGQEENDKERKLCIWKDPIGGRKVFDYKKEDRIFVPVYKSDNVGDCFNAMKKHLVEVNFQDGKSVFSRTELLEGLKNYSRAHVDRTIKEHLAKGGFLKKQTDSNGKVQRGKFVLKNIFKINKEEQEELYKNPTKYLEETEKLWKTEEKEKKDYSHMFFKTTPEGSIPHPDRHTIAPDYVEGTTTKMEATDVIDAIVDAREKGTDIVDI